MNTPLDPTLLSALREWREWPVSEQPRCIKQFDEGLNHLTALLETAEGMLVLKVFSAEADNAIQAQRWAAELGIAPEIVYQSKSKEYCVMRYAGAASLAEQDLTDNGLRALALSLRTMHSTPASSLAKQTGEFDIFYWCQQYLPSAGVDAADIHQALAGILAAYTNDATKRCFCHNDLVAENCFIDKQGAVFIDWEFAQWHNPWFDLAAIVYYLKLDLSQASLFLETYCPGWGQRINAEIFFSSQIALLWGDMLWHLAKYGIVFWPKLDSKMTDLRCLARQLGTELP